MSLKTDYKNYVPSEDMGGRRRYRKIDNPDGTISLEDVTTYEIEGSKFGADDMNATNKAVNYSIVETTLEQLKWGTDNPPQYTLEVEGVTETNINEILPAIDITESQAEALQQANLFDAGQEVGKIILKALGERPNQDIPVRVIVRGDIQ